MSTDYRYRTYLLPRHHSLRFVWLFDNTITDQPIHSLLRQDTTDEDSDFEEGYRRKTKPIMLKIKKEKVSLLFGLFLNKYRIRVLHSGSRTSWIRIFLSGCQNNGSWSVRRCLKFPIFVLSCSQRFSMVWIKNLTDLWGTGSSDGFDGWWHLNKGRGRILNIQTFFAFNAKLGWFYNVSGLFLSTTALLITSGVQ